MKSFKHIITSGCSFSDQVTKFTWPHQIESLYGANCIHMGLGSQGNSLIARKALYAVQEIINQGVEPEDILVGIMWSGPDRHDSYFSHLSAQLPDDVKNKDYMLVNPTRQNNFAYMF